MPGLTHVQRAARRERIADYCRRHSAAKATEKFGVSRSLVQASCIESGVVAHAPDRSRLRLIAALVNTRTSFSTLAAKHALTRQAVQQLASKCIAAGLKVRSRAA